MPLGISIGLGLNSFPMGGNSLSPPINTVAPVASSTAEVGETLSTTNGTWTGSPSFGYQWQNSSDNITFANIGAATASTYVLVAGDDNKYVRCQVTGTNGDGASTANSNALGPVVTTPAGIAGIETWFDPVSLVPLGDGALIDTWVDEQGGASASGAGAARPSVDLDGLNGAPGILFGSGDTLTLSRVTTVPWTECIVVLPANTSTRRLITYNGGGAVPYLEALNASNRTVSGSTPGTTASLDAVQFTKPFIMLRTVTATLQRFFYNQTMIGSSTAQDNFTNTITAISHPTTFAYTGHAGDYVRFSTELSDADKGKLFAYLVAKYDILHNFIVCDGDSLTIGTIGVGANDNYPQQMIDNLNSTYGVQRFSKYNYGVNSAEIAARAAAFAAQSGRWAEHVGNGILNIYVFWCGTNNLFTGMSAADTYSAYVSACQAAQAAGFAVCACTIMNHAITGSWTQAAADTVNASIRANWQTFATYFADIQADARLQTVTNLTYFLGDEVHLTATGYGVVAEIVEAALGL